MRQQLRAWMQDNAFNKAQYAVLQEQARQLNIQWSNFLLEVLPDTLWYLERSMAMAAADDIITPEEEAYIRGLAQAMSVPDQHLQPILARLDRLIALSKIRQGEIKPIKTKNLLEADELCYLDTKASYRKVTKRAENWVPGRFVATNKSLHFLSSGGGWKILWKNIMQIESDQATVYIELSVKQGNGQYKVDDPEMIQALLESIVKLQNRQITSPTQRDTRHIPQHIRTAVWQRDNGQCVQCKASSYLEFDHIIPFSKGGATSEGNLQLLCRKCNLAKGDRL